MVGLSAAIDGNDPATMRRMLNMMRGGQAADPYGFASGQIVNTSGQYAPGGLGHAIGMILPGGGFTNAFGRLAQSAFGPYGVVGMEEVGIGHPQWGEKIQAIRNAQMRNQSERLREERMKNKNRSRPRSIAPGRRGARDRGRSGGADRGGRARGEGAAGGNENAPEGRGRDGL